MGDPGSGADADPMSNGRAPDPLGTFRGSFALPGEVAMFAFGLGFPTTGRYVSVPPRPLGAGAVVVGLYRTVGGLIGAVYPIRAARSPTGPARGPRSRCPVWRRPPASCLLATPIGLVGTGYFLVRGEEFDAYA